MTDKNKALIAMSGGVDSAVAALLLNNSYSLTGITMRLWENDAPAPDDLNATADLNASEAKKIASILNFPHLTVALGSSFYDNVVKTFIEAYRRGNTPNPCVECNKHIKFGKLFDIANDLDISYLATGHYANITKNYNGDFELRKALDPSKDQSYFLWSIKKEKLPFILFPLGNYTKAEIRELAEKNGFSNAHRADSQDICFVNNGDYVSFLKKHGISQSTKGNFIDTQGHILGEHLGIEKYTIGQRKGLGVSFGKPMFVCQKNALDNTVTLCEDNELYRSSLVANSINLLVNENFDIPIRLEAKIRYRHFPAKATVERIDTDKIKVVFDAPQRAITSGQSLVLYDGSTVIGGGIIE